MIHWLLVKTTVLALPSIWTMGCHQLTLKTSTIPATVPLDMVAETVPRTTLMLAKSHQCHYVTIMAPALMEKEIATAVIVL